MQAGLVLTNACFATFLTAKFCRTRAEVEHTALCRTALQRLAVLPPSRRSSGARGSSSSGKAPQRRRQPPPAAALPEEWPSAGRLQVQSLSLRYEPLPTSDEEVVGSSNDADHNGDGDGDSDRPLAPSVPLALRDVSLDLRPGEKLAVVGRTGAGKSSLLASITRLVEPTAGGGRPHPPFV